MVIYYKKEIKKMTYLKDSSYRTFLKIENGRVCDYPSYHTRYLISNDKLTDFSGKILCRFEGDRVKDFSGRILIIVSMDTVKTLGGQIIAKYDTTTIKTLSGQIQYRIDGFLSRSEWMALFAILYAV